MLQEEAFFESEKQIFGALRRAGFAPKTILDIGASNGEWTESCLDVFPTAKYFLYEPLYLHLDHYKAGIDALTARHKDICLRTVGLSDHVGTADFYITPNFVGSSLLPLKVAQKVEVSVTTLDAEFGDTNQNVDIIKMDTQGGELLIVKGAKSVMSRASLVVAECWLYPGYGAPTPLAHQIIHELRQFDLHVFGMGAPYYNAKNVLCALDIYFARSDILKLLGSHPMSRIRDNRDTSGKE